MKSETFACRRLRQTVAVRSWLVLDGNVHLVSRVQAQIDVVLTAVKSEIFLR